jgi:alpha-N-arabinofuranosidase
MFRVHQGAKLLNTDLRCEDYEFGGKKIPAVSASASVDDEGKMHITLANLNPGKEITLSCPIIGDTFMTVTGEILTAGEMAAFNSFDNPESVKPVAYNGFKLKEGILTITLPSKSVIALELKK